MDFRYDPQEGFSAEEREAYEASRELQERDQS